MFQRLRPDSLEIARKYAGWFLSYQAESLFAHLPPDGQQETGSPTRITSQIVSFTSQAGSENQLLEERWVSLASQPPPVELEQ